jgi:hypothetical protein
MRVIVGKERPHPGAQLRLTRGQLPDLEMRNGRRARCDDRIRVAKDTGPQNLPLHGFGQNQIWCAIVQLAMELTTWMQMLALHGHPAAAGGTQTTAASTVHDRRTIAARIAHHPRRTRLRLSARAHGPNYSRWL